LRDSNRQGPSAGSGRWTGDRRKVEDRRAGQERRAGGERRVREESRAAAERRSGRDRRAGERRTPRERRSEADWVTVPLEFDANTALGSAQELLVAAIDARTRAHARYSGFKVGAALATPEGRVFTGCNIENATYGLTLCAERVALVKALSEAASVFTRIVVVADTEAPTPPCGSCRQLLWEYCGDIEVVLANLSGPISRHRLAALLPLPFDGRLLE
jgi:cytidine deaminase